MFTFEQNWNHETSIIFNKMLGCVHMTHVIVINQWLLKTHFMVLAGLLTQG